LTRIASKIDRSVGINRKAPMDSHIEVRHANDRDCSFRVRAMCASARVDVAQIAVMATVNICLQSGHRCSCDLRSHELPVAQIAATRR
jgi:fatty acid desaturase